MRDDGFVDEDMEPNPALNEITNAIKSGILLNFNVPVLKEGIRRIAN